MVNREELLQAVAEDSHEAFLQVVEKHNSRADPFDLSELITSLSSHQVEEIWSNLQTKCNATLLSFHTDQEDEQLVQELEQAITVLQGIVTVAMSTIQADTPRIPTPLLETAVVLHGILPSLPENGSKLQANIAKLCEVWWTNNLEGREELAMETIKYLIQKSLDPKATGADIKRVWAMREYLAQIDMEDETSENMKSVLCQTLMSVSFVKHEKGRRFLSYLFQLNLEFVNRLHKTIKNQIPSCARSMVEWYGEIYFQAWREATVPFLTKIEQSCIQDLMYHAVHAKRGSTKSMASILRKVLGCFHKQKKQRGVDEMLLRLYEPILWRSLKVANGMVRANAAALLIDVFPLQDPESNNEANDALMQKQFDVLETMLFDPCPLVRVTAVQGVCRICNVFWELIPSATISAFLTKLIVDLAWDGSSSDVRVAVITGLTHLLGNHLSHPILKALLPRLQNLLHDTAEKVRVAFVDLLLKVKGMRAIKYWSIAPMEHLLARLETDTPPVCKRIVTLIFNSFMSVDKPGDVQLTRCVTLIENNPGAARRFYQYAHRHMSTAATGKFMLLLCRCILGCIRREAEQNGETSESHPADEEEKENENQDEGAEELSIHNTEVIAGLLEAILILWEGIEESLKKPGNADVQEKLQMWFSKGLPAFFRTFQDTRINSSLILLAGHLPPNTIPTFSRSTISKLKGMTTESGAEDYGTLLESMCKWNKVKDVLDLISDWLDAGIVEKSAEGACANSKSSRKGRTVMFVEPVEPQPMLALEYLTYMMRHSVCQHVLLTTAKPALREIATVMYDVTRCIEKRLESLEPLSDHTSDDFLTKAFELYMRLEVLIHDPDNHDHNALTVMEQLLTWADVQILPLFKQRKPQKRRLLNQTDMTLLAGPSEETTMMGATTTFMSTTLAGSKRSASESQSVILSDMGTEIVQSLLTVAANMLLVGVGDQELASHLADFASTLLRTEESIKFLPLISQLMYQITELTLTRDKDEVDEGVGSQGDIVPGMLTKVIQMLASLVKNKREMAERVLPTIKSTLAQMLQVYYRHQLLRTNPSKDVMATIMAAVVAEMTNTVKRDNEFERCEKFLELPLLSGFLLGILNKRTVMVSMFNEELCQCVKSGAVERLEGLVAILHVIYVISKVKHSGSGSVAELKECIGLLEGQLGQLTIPEDTPEESPIRHLQQRSKILLKDCMTQLGMVA